MLPADFNHSQPRELAHLAGFSELVYLGTCNRVEFYFRGETRLHTLFKDENDSPTPVRSTGLERGPLEAAEFLELVSAGFRVDMELLAGRIKDRRTTVLRQLDPTVGIER